MKPTFVRTVAVGFIAMGLTTTSLHADSAPTPAVQWAPLSEVRLLDSPFKTAMEVDQTYLLRLEPDRFLAWFRKEAGLPEKGKVYGGWESRGVAGQTLGHYLSACSEMYASTGDKRFLDRVNYIVDELAICQTANGNGYAAAIPNGKQIFDEIAHGQINTKGGLNGGWVPWYTIHKTLAGLRDAYQLAGNEKAKTLLIGFADWVDRTTAGLSDAQMQEMLKVEQGGMVEVLADVYAITGDEKYLKLSQRFTHHAVLDPLAVGVDKLAGLHDNTQIPKIIGSARRYELTGDAYDKNAATFFYDAVVHHRTYAIGGHSENEHFGPPDQLAKHLGPTSAETCNTYNTLKLNRHLFSWDPKAEYADYYERCLYNHILVSQDAQSGMVTYFVSMKPGSFRTLSTPFDSMWCCVGTGMENHATYGAAIYAHDDSGLWVNQFIPSVLTWSEKSVVVEQTNQFPIEPSTKLTIKTAPSSPMAIHIRKPVWTGDGMTVSINGTPQKVATDANGYVVTTRTWAAGDVVDIGLPMSLHTESLPDDPSKQAILYGPLVLAGRLGTEGMIGQMPFATGEQMYRTVPTPPVPVLVTDGKPVEQWVKPVANQPLLFETVGVGRPHEVELLPFYRLGRERYSIYWNTMTASQYQSHHAAEEAAAAKQRELDALTIDILHPGEQQSDQDHNFAGEQTRTGEHGDVHYRDAAPGGWFSYSLKVLPDQPTNLVCTYWGGERLQRTFDVLVDGQRVATQSLHNDHPDEFFDETYPLPAELTRGKPTITVKFQSSGESMAGGVFGCRTMRQAN